MGKKVFVYGVGIFFSKIIVFLMVPIYTRVFSVADYGYYDVIIQNMQMVVSIAFIEIWSGALRFMFDYEDRAKPIRSIIRLFPFLMIAYFIALFVLSLFTVIKYPMLTIAYGILFFLFSLSNSICRGYENNLAYVVSGIVSTVTACVLSIVFAVYLHKGIEFLMLAQCIGYLFAVIYVEAVTHCYRISFSDLKKYSDLKEMLTYCFPLMLNSFSFLFLGTYNKNAILNSLGEIQSGYYGYISKYSSIFSILISIYTLAWTEHAYQKATAENRNEIYSYYINSFIKLFGTAVSVFILLVYWAAPFVGGAQYLEATVYIPFAVFSAFVAGVSAMLSTLLAVNKDTKYILISTALGALINVTIISVFLKKYGINAASVALCIGYFITSLFRYIYANKKLHITIQVLPIVLVMAEIIAVNYSFILNANLLCMALLGISLIICFIMNYDMLKKIVIKVLDQLHLYWRVSK